MRLKKICLKIKLHCACPFLHANGRGLVGAYQCPFFQCVGGLCKMRMIWLTCACLQAGMNRRQWRRPFYRGFPRDAMYQISAKQSWTKDFFLPYIHIHIFVLSLCKAFSIKDWLEKVEMGYFGRRVTSQHVQTATTLISLRIRASWTEYCLFAVLIL